MYHYVTKSRDDYAAKLARGDGMGTHDRTDKWVQAASRALGWAGLGCCSWALAPPRLLRSRRAGALRSLPPLLTARRWPAPLWGQVLGQGGAQVHGTV